VVGVDAVNEVALIILRGVVSTFSSKQRRLSNVPVASGAVFTALNVESMCNLYLEHFDVGLMDSKVGHLNVKTVEVDAVETFVDCLGKLAFANLLNPDSVVQCAGLMELPE